VSVKAELLTWVLEPENPSARYLTLTEVLDRAPDDPDVAAARAAIPNVKPARAILDAQFAGSGYWIKPDVGYSPKYRATVWQVVFLAQLGAPPIEPPIEAVRRACDYVLDHSRRLTDRRGNLDGRFVAGKAARTAVNCLNGNLLWALGRLGHGRLKRARQQPRPSSNEALPVITMAICPVLGGELRRFGHFWRYHPGSDQRRWQPL
jgi:hypothetical protein